MDLNNIKSLNDLRRVINSYGYDIDIKKPIICPFHSEKTASLHIYEKNGKGLYKCQGCGAGGDVIDFTQRMENLDFMKAVEIVHNKLGIESPKVISMTKKFEEHLKKHSLYKESNGLPLTKIYYYQSKDSKDDTPSFIKVKYDGTINGKRKKSFRTYGIDIKEYNGQSYYAPRKITIEDETIYNIRAVVKAKDIGKDILFVEGEKDADNLNARGFTSTTIKGKTSDVQLWGIYKKQLQGTNIVIIPDNGQAGESYGESAYKHLKDVANTIKIVNLPGLAEMGDNKDVTDWLEAGHTVDELKKAINNTPLMVLENYGKYSYDGKTTYYMGQDKEGEPKKINVYDGQFKIMKSKTNLETNEETLIISSTVFGKTSMAEIKKGDLLGPKCNEIMNNQKNFIINPAYSKEIKPFFYDLYRHNIQYDLLEQIKVTSKLGWRDNTFIYPSSKTSLDGEIYFVPNKGIEGKFTSKGIFKQSIENVLIPLLSVELGAVLVAGAISSLIMERLNIHESFIIDVFGKNTSGKTICLYATASLFGPPREYCLDWNSTKNNIMTTASTLRNFPVLLDDTKKCPNKKMLVDVVYSFTGGIEKGRNNQDGTSKEAKTFNNIAISTGETTIRDLLKGENSGAGAHARIVSADINEVKTTHSKEMADKLAENSKQYYGVFAPEFCRWLMNYFNTDCFEATKDLYRNYIDINYAKAKEHFGIRQGNHMALLMTAYELIQIFLRDHGITIEDKSDIFTRLLEYNNECFVSEDIYKIAYDEFISRAISDSARIYNGGAFAPNNCIGWIKDNILYISRGEYLKEILEKHGDTNDILRAWKDMGLIKADKGKSQTRATPPWTNGRPRVYAIYIEKGQFTDVTEDMQQSIF